MSGMTIKEVFAEGMTLQEMFESNTVVEVRSESLEAMRLGIYIGDGWRRVRTTSLAVNAGGWSMNIVGIRGRYYIDKGNIRSIKRAKN